MWKREPSEFGKRLSMGVLVAGALFILLSPFPWYLSVGIGWLPVGLLYSFARDSRMDAIAQYYCRACGHDIQRESLVVPAAQGNPRCENCGSRLHAELSAKSTD